MTFIDELKDSEGFRGMPYDDHLGNPTIGYGTLLPLSPVEGELLLRHRLEMSTRQLGQALQVRGIEPATLPPGVWQALRDMAYNMGVPRLMGFKKMLAAIEQGSWQTAKAEALDSKWACQVPNRAAKVVKGFTAQE